MTSPADPITTLCHGVMTGVARLVKIDTKDAAAVDRAVTVMRDEIKAFLMGDEYAAERAALDARTVSQQTVLASLVASCVAKIQAA